MVVAALLFALVLTAGTLHRTGVLGLLSLTMLSTAWFLVNGRADHATLLVLSPGHGITVLDAAGAAGLVLVVGQALRLASGRREAPRHARRDKETAASPSRNQ